jgi:hypothetical protein
MRAFEYIFVAISDDGKTIIRRPDLGRNVIEDRDDVLATLNDLGKDGWELVQGPNSNDKNYILKRQVK